jgi:hypothetical protein
VRILQTGAVLEGRAFAYLEQMIEDPIYPKKRMHLTGMTVRGYDGGAKVLWRFETEDGVFPSDGGYGRTPLQGRCNPPQGLHTELD